MAVTLSSGSIHLIQFPTQEFTTFKILEPENIHSLEAWCCAFSTSQDPIPGSAGRTLYSGGDDAKLRAMTLDLMPLGPDDDSVLEAPLLSTVFSPHEAGVTAILPLPLPISTSSSLDLGDILLTGGYDDYVRVYSTYDTRPGAAKTRPKVLAELYIGGGVWRLKFLDEPRCAESKGPWEVATFRILASCMHAGARILQVSGARNREWSIEVLGEVTDHQSMCYACDVQPLEPPAGKWGEQADRAGWEGETKRLCVSTSFYDRLMCVWTFDPKVDDERILNE